MPRLRVYVAGPLSSVDLLLDEQLAKGDPVAAAECRKLQRLANVERAMEAGRHVIRAGHAPLVPHLTHWLDPDDACGYEAWIETCLAWIAVADAVLRLPGFSRGADREVTLALRSGIPVVYDVADLSAPSVVARIQRRRKQSSTFQFGD